VILKPCVHIASTLEICGRGTKVLYVRLVSNNARGNAATREEPHLDVLGGPFHGVYSSVVAVEGLAKVGYTTVCVNVTARGGSGTVEGTVIRCLRTALA
jgi:hypothetical protein